MRARTENSFSSARTVSVRGNAPSAESSATPAMPNVSSPVNPSTSTDRAVDKLEGQHSHTDEIRTVNAFEAFGDHGANTEQLRALGGPVARRARPVLLAGQDDERNAVARVPHGGVVDGRRVPIGKVTCEAAFGARRQPVP